MAITVVAEKPSVARDLARALGATRSDEGFLEGSGYRVTWALGHLVGLAEPHEMRPEWKRWLRELLPMLPKEWPLAVFDKTRSQFEVVKRLKTCRTRTLCATDAVARKTIWAGTWSCPPLVACSPAAATGGYNAQAIRV